MFWTLKLIKYELWMNCGQMKSEFFFPFPLQLLLLLTPLSEILIILMYLFSPLWGSLLAVVLVAFLFFSWFYFIVLLFFFFSLIFFLRFFFFFCFLILLEQYIEAHVKFCHFPLVTGEISENKHSSSEVHIWVLLVLLMNSDKSSQWSCFDLTDLAVLTFFSASAAQVPSFL